MPHQRILRLFCGREEPSQMVKDESGSSVLERGAGGRRHGLRRQGAWSKGTLTGIRVRDAGSWTDAEAAGMERWRKRPETMKPGDTCRG